jgi:hypothetical protein
MLRVDLGNRAREAGQVGQVAGVVCGGGRGEDGAEEGKVLGVDGERLRVQRLVDLLPSCEADGGARSGGGGEGEDAEQ